MALHHLQPWFLMIINSLGVTGYPENMMSAGALAFLSQESTHAWSQVKRPRFQSTFILICLSSSMAHVHEPNCILMPLTSPCIKALKVSFSLCYSRVPCTSVGIFSPCVDTPVIIAGTVGLKTKFPDVNTNCSVDPLPSLENCLWLTGGLLRPPVEPTATADSCGGSTPACGSGWESSVLPFTLQPPRGVG